MLYAERDEKGSITAVRKDPVTPDQKPLADEELIQFLSQSGDPSAYATILALMDTRIIRVLDDLIELLVKKNVIMFTDLPEEARQKIGERKRIRRHLQESGQLTVDDIL